MVQQTTGFLSWTVKTRPNTIVKHDLVQPLLQLCLSVVKESHERELSNYHSEDGEDLLDLIFLCIPVEITFPLAISVCVCVFVLIC